MWQVKDREVCWSPPLERYRCTNPVQNDRKTIKEVHGDDAKTRIFDVIIDQGTRLLSCMMNMDLSSTVASRHLGPWHMPNRSLGTLCESGWHASRHHRELCVSPSRQFPETSFPTTTLRQEVSGNFCFRDDERPKESPELLFFVPRPLNMRS